MAEYLFFLSHVNLFSIKGEKYRVDPMIYVFFSHPLVQFLIIDGYVPAADVHLFRTPLVLEFDLALVRFMFCNSTILAITTCYTRVQK